MHNPQTKSWDHGTVAQIPRNSLIMLMAAQALVVIPHIAQISFWIIGAGLFCAWWRWMIFLGRKNFPSFLQKLALVFVCTTGVIISEGITKNLETWAALLIVAFALKLLEMKTRRDAYVVIFIAYFVISIEFIFNNTIGIALYEIFALVLVTAAMVGMNQFHTRINPTVSLKVASKILLQAVPLMIVIFILFPRISPIWSIASPGQKARTGLSSEMTPGDIAKLARSDEIVFRAIFENEVLPANQLYWRGRVYSRFNQGTWSAVFTPNRQGSMALVNWAHTREKAWFTPDVTNLEKLSYSVLFEPNNNQWLLGLDLAIPKSETTGLTWDFRIVNKQPIQSIFRYEVDTYLNAKLNLHLPDFIRAQTTEVQENDNPKIISFARELFKASSNTEEFVEKVLSYIRNQPYHYTLEPPTLERAHSIDQFWFDTRAGFCTHYAGAFTYMMRAVGIPARMVGGYQGGEINPITKHIVVRQYLAHAWVEIWLPGKGWQRIDPTAAVAPSRINDGINAALAEDELSSLSAFSNLRLNKVPGLQKFMFLLESLEHRWNLFVIGYDSSIQTDFLEKLLGKISALKIALVLFIGAALSMIFIAFSLFWSRSKKSSHPALKIFNVFAKKLEKYGIYRKAQETPAQFIDVTCKNNNLKEKDYQAVTKLLNDLLYNPKIKITKDNLKDLKNNLRLLQLKLST